MKPRLLMRLAGCAVAMLAVALLAAPAFAQAPAPTPNKGDTAFMFVSTVIVLMMTIPIINARPTAALRADRRRWRVRAGHRSTEVTS